jgi:hypothetical protein
VKSLLFIIVVIVYLQYLEEKEREVERKRSFFFAAYIIRLANLLLITLLRSFPQ